MKSAHTEPFKEQSHPPILSMTWPVLKHIIDTIGGTRAETGGVIGGNGDGTSVSHFHFDESSRNSAVTYSPDHEFLNKLFRDTWNPQNIRFRGFIHSHPGRMSRPSYGDEIYAERILRAIDDLEFLWLPIVSTVPNTGVFKLTPWAAFRAKKGVSVVRGKVEILRAPAKSTFSINGVQVLQALKTGEPMDEILVGKEKPDLVSRIAGKPKDEETSVVETANDTPGEQPEWKHETATSFNVRNTFDRVRDAYDLDLMHNSRIIAVGAGGAADWLEQMARVGIGQFVMIDPDTVSETNLATQQTYRKDIGRPKVDCIAERIRDINPTTRTIAIQKKLDELSDEEIRRLAFDPIDGYEARQTVICGLTDNFHAQAQVNRIAMQFGLPSLCAQVYREGRGAEITFTYPGVTPACHRCILSSRYRHFLENGQRNDVTSHGTPIFATARLNAIKGFIALAILHHGTNHPRWGAMLSRIGKRNLVQVRMDPDFADTLGVGTFNRVFEKADQNRLFFDETVWLPQDEECPETGYPKCPDCGGTGDLRNAIGSLQSTQLPKTEEPSLTKEEPMPSAKARQAFKTYQENGGIQ